MSQKKLPTLVATRPVLYRETVFTEGEPYIARSAEEAAELEGEPSWRRATKKDLDAWSTRLSRDPAIAYLRERPPVTETEYDQHPEETAQAAEDAKAKAEREAEAKAQAEAAQKAADEARAASAAKAKAEGDSQPGPSGGVPGPGGIG
jgi:membrane protein involved in colicin uptake